MKRCTGGSINIDTLYEKTGFIERFYNYIIFSIASVFFGYITIRMVFPVIKNRLHPLKGFTAVLVFFLCFLILWAVDKYLIRKMNQKTAKAAIITLIAINAVLQVLCVLELKVKPSWDFGAIINAADDISAGRAVRNWGYFQEYPYNLYPAVIVGTFKFLLGGNPAAPYILNIICVTSSIIGACLLANKTYGQRAAVLTALFCLAATPLYLGIPIVYTDTLSMPFVIWTLYAWSFIRNGGKRLILYGALIGLLSAAGFLVKQIAALGLAAFVFDFIINWKKYIPVAYQTKRSLLSFLKGTLPLAAAFFTFFLIISAFKFYVDYKGFDNRIDYNKSLPYTHWLMMGMNTMPSEGGTSSGYGGFSAQDLKYSRAYSTSLDKKIAEITIIKNRLSQFGIDGYADFLLKKIEWTWTDGTYFVPVKLARYPVRRTFLHRFVLFSDGRANKLYLVFTQFVQMILLSMILTGCIASLKTGSDRTFRLMSLMCLGLMFFLLFWETRSRYLIFMIPVFAVMTVYGITLAFREVDKVSAYLHRTLKSLFKGSLEGT
jgi:hypothetical protein